MGIIEGLIFGGQVGSIRFEIMGMAEEFSLLLNIAVGIVSILIGRALWTLRAADDGQHMQPAPAHALRTCLRGEPIHTTRLGRLGVCRRIDVPSHDR